MVLSLRQMKCSSIQKMIAVVLRRGLECSGRAANSGARKSMDAVLRPLHKIGQCTMEQWRQMCRGLHGQKDLNFIGLLATFWRILGDTKFLSDML